MVHIGLLKEQADEIAARHRGTMEKILVRLEELKHQAVVISEGLHLQQAKWCVNLLHDIDLMRNECRPDLIRQGPVANTTMIAAPLLPLIASVSSNNASQHSDAGVVSPDKEVIIIL